jgi:3-hydroxybutyryl-CoA dehydrogenase
MEYLVQATYDPRFRPAPLLRRMAQAGDTGRRAGRGFFTYPEQ